jgi:hypothetical protein
MPQRGNAMKALSPLDAFNHFAGPADNETIDSTGTTRIDAASPPTDHEPETQGVVTRPLGSDAMRHQPGINPQKL